MMEAMLSSKTSSLCFNRDEFSADDFSVDKFVSDCRKYAPLDKMQEDLNLYHKMLCAALIELINQDYADFVNLSSNLVGLDESIKNLSVPLEHMKNDIKNFKADFDGTLDAVQSIFSERSATHKMKVLVKHVLCVLQGLGKIDEINAQASKGSAQDVPSDVLERIALDWNLVKFHMLKLSTSDVSVLDHKKEDVEKMAISLDGHLESMFLKSLSQNDKKNLLKVLRIYSVINKESDAESSFREQVVKPFIRNHLTQENISKYGITRLYSDILDFVGEVCGPLLDVTRASNRQNAELVPGFDFLVSAVWPEVVHSLEFVAPVYVYAPGDPSLFHQNYLATMTFLREFESRCRVQTSVVRFRRHPAYREFLSKWNLDLYFQIRFQEIASEFETALLHGFDAPSDPVSFLDNGPTYELSATNALCFCLKWCWADNVFLSPLMPQFWRVTLQILSRYCKWASSSLTTSEMEISSHAKTSSIIKDVEQLLIELCVFFKEVVCVRIFKVTRDVGNLEMAFDTAVASLEKIPVLAGDYVVKLLKEQCFTHLKLISDIPRLYRKTNRQMPKNPSGYVISMKNCLTNFLSETEGILSSTWRKNCLKNVLEGIVTQSSEMMHEVLTSIKKMEDSLKILKRARENFKPAFENATSSTITDDDKMRHQLNIDVQFLQKMIEELGLEAGNIGGFAELLSLVRSADRAHSQN